MKAVIIEDEQLAAEKLEKMLRLELEEVEVQAKLQSVEQAVEWFKIHEEPDVVFSDIQIADGLSFEIYKAVQVKCPIIFTTAYDQYALDAFEVNSVDYLLKPIKQAKLKESLRKLEELKTAFNVDQQSVSVEQLMHYLTSGADQFKSRFMVKVGQKIRSVKTAEIAYFFSKDKMNMLMTHAGQKFPVDYSLDELVGMLDPKSFFRVNRQFLIHIDSASEINPYFKGRLKVTLQPSIDDEIIVSSEKTPTFKVWLDQ